VGRQRHFIRNVKSADYLEYFLVAAVAAVLAVRFYLHLTGYPQVGGEVLHLAHVLWGGLFMAVAIFLLTSFLSRRTTRFAVVLGGVGFGLFIDEVGKFMTSDNDYFFRPAVAIMYAVIVLLILAGLGIRRLRGYTQEEYLVNALKEMEEVALRDLDREEKQRALRYLGRSDPENPLVPILKDLLARIELVPEPPPGLWARTKHRIHDLYARATELPGFRTALVIFFVGQLLFRLAYIFVLVFLVGLGRETPPAGILFKIIAVRAEHLSFISLAQVASSLLSAVFVVLGVIHLRRSRLFAYRDFKRSVLVTIFLTQIFLFYEKQFEALVGLGLNILLLVILDYMLERERAREASAG
jgi:hypothetical protein